MTSHVEEEQASMVTTPRGASLRKGK